MNKIDILEFIHTRGAVKCREIAEQFYGGDPSDDDLRRVSQRLKYYVGEGDLARVKVKGEKLSYQLAPEGGSTEVQMLRELNRAERFRARVTQVFETYQCDPGAEMIERLEAAIEADT